MQVAMASRWPALQSMGTQMHPFVYWFSHLYGILLLSLQLWCGMYGMPSDRSLPGHPAPSMVH